MGEHEPTGAEDGVAEVKSGSPVSDADRATPDSGMPQFDMPKDSGVKDADAVDTTDPNFAVEKFRKSSGPVRTDPSGYGIRDEYETSAQKGAREAAYRERNGLEPHPVAPAPEKKGFLSQIKGLLRGRK